MQMGGVRSGRHNTRKSSVQPKKKGFTRARLAKESGDRRSSMRKQEPCHRASAARDRMAVIRSGEQDVGMAHPGHRAGQQRRRLRGALEPPLKLDAGNAHRARPHHAPVLFQELPVPAPATRALPAPPLPPSLLLRRRRVLGVLSWIF